MVAGGVSCAGLKERWQRGWRLWRATVLACGGPVLELLKLLVLDRPVELEGCTGGLEQRQGIGGCATFGVFNL